jgi:hypothetical protein
MCHKRKIFSASSDLTANLGKNLFHPADHPFRSEERRPDGLPEKVRDRPDSVGDHPEGLFSVQTVIKEVANSIFQLICMKILQCKIDLS